MHIQYIGEHLFPGDIGKLFLWLGFGTAILATIFYFFSFYLKDHKKIWKTSARGLYIVHALSMVTVAVVLYFLIFKHYFEYAYV